MAETVCLAGSSQHARRQLFILCYGLQSKLNHLGTGMHAECNSWQPLLQFLVIQRVQQSCWRALYERVLLGRTKAMDW